MLVSEVPHIARHLLEKHGLLQKGWRFKFDRAKRRCGCCKYGQKVICLSLDYVQLNVDSQPWNVLDTILHEIAHALTGPLAKAHGLEWQATCLRIGARPERCSDAAAEMPKGRFVARCPSCGIEHHRYRSVKAGRYRYCKLCGPVKGVLHYVDSEAAKQPESILGGNLTPARLRSYVPPPPRTLD